MLGLILMEFCVETTTTSGFLGTLRTRNILLSHLLPTAAFPTTLSVWRTHMVHTGDGDELRVVQETANEHSVTIKETLRIIWVYDSNCPTLLVKSL